MALLLGNFDIVNQLPQIHEAEFSNERTRCPYVSRDWTIIYQTPVWRPTAQHIGVLIGGGKRTTPEDAPLEEGA